MKTIGKKILMILAVLTMAVAVPLLSGCTYYSAAGLEGNYWSGEVSSQGGWVVQKGDYIYFINGVKTLATDDDGNVTETYENDYGDVTRGSLMRIAVSDLDAGNYDAAETVVPLLMVADDYTAGIFIYGDYVYYATPTTARNLQGETESNYVDFKRSRLDGKETMRGYYFRSDDAAAEYRFVEVDGTVYCLHMDDSDLWSYNTETDEDTLLAKDTASHLFNGADVSDPYVYYTMNVTEDIDQTNSTTNDYTQVYRVRADATYDLDYREGSYTVADGTETYEYTYEFDVDSLEDIADDASEDDEAADFDARDIETYPYVNLGQLVLDGIGDKDELSQYNHSASEPYAPDGFTYTLIAYDNGGLYYRLSYVATTDSTGEDGWTFYLSEENFGADWDSVAGNPDTDASDWENEPNDIISKKADQATSSAIFYIKDGKHYYLYTSGTEIVRVELDQSDSSLTETEVTVARNVSVSSFLYLDNDSSDTYKYVWYTTSSETGVGIGRAVYDSTEDGYAGNEEDSYNFLTGKDDYQPTTVLGIDHPSDWYAPEVIGNYVFFIDSSSIGEFTLNTACVSSLANDDGDMMTNSEIEAYNDLLDEVSDALSDASAFSTNIGNFIYYYYYTGDSQMFWTVIDEYIDEDDEIYGQYSIFSRDEQNYYTAYVNCTDYTKGKLTAEFSTLLFLKDEDGEPITNEDGEKIYFGLRSYFYNTIGVLDEDEEEELEDAWRANYLSALPLDDDSLEAWAWALIGVGIGVGVIGIACGITVPLVLRRRKLRAAEEGTSGPRKKYKVDMTYDEDIDVYADDDFPAVRTKDGWGVPDEPETDIAEDILTEPTEESGAETPDGTGDGEDKTEE